MAGDAQLTLLQQVVELSREMLAVAEAERFDRLPEMEAQRHALIERCFGPDVEAADDDQVSEQIVRILDMDERLAAMVKGERDAIAQDVKTLRRGREVVKDYQEMGR